VGAGPAERRAILNEANCNWGTVTERGTKREWESNTHLLLNYSQKKVLQVAPGNKAYAAQAGPKSWNFADMLAVGNLGDTTRGDTESQTNVSL